MSSAPANLLSLQSYWKSQGGVSLGIVGNAAHTKGYHLGKDRIFDGSGPGLGWNDYSVRTARDKAGLSNYASALDLGRLNGTLLELRKFSVWLVAQCRAGAAGTKDIREIIYTPDGKTVYGWSREAGQNSAPIKGYGDLSHITHTHISWYRDSRSRDQRPIFKKYFAATAIPLPPPTSTAGDDMPAITKYIPGHIATIKNSGGAVVRSAPTLSASTKLRVIPAGSSESWEVTGWVDGAAAGSPSSTAWITRWNGTRWEYAHKINVSRVAEPVQPVADCTDAVNAAVAPLKLKVAGLETRIAGIKTKVAASAADIADD